MLRTGNKALVLLLIASTLLPVLAERGLAHDPKKKNTKPTKAAPAIKKTREKLDAAKAKLSEAGKYRCCVKPSCDMCALNGGACSCAESVAAGHGSCGECMESWAAGLGNAKGVDPKSITVNAASSRPVEEELRKLEELVAARESLESAKRILASEGRYACCITKGCGSCALGGECPCGSDLATAAPGTKAAVCGECMDGWHAGHGAFPGIEVADLKLAEMSMSMPSSFAIGTMFRQGSGTSWIPESSPMFASMKQAGSWLLMAHPVAHVTYSNHTGPRGQDGFYSTNWLMGSAQREVGGLTGAGRGTLLLRGMISLDPATVGKEGYPLLFQTGETANGKPLIDRQHPHDFFMEFGVAYSAPIGKGLVLSTYFAPMGEPALGPAAYPHRLSAMDNPEAPIGHHWQDSSHIAAGVATIGFGQRMWKVEGSVFTGREPDENRWNFEKPKFDSWSARLSVNPHRDFSMQVSYGLLKEPEAFEPGVHIRRMTASISHQRPIGDRSFIASTFVWGRNYKAGGQLVRSYATDAILAEASYSWRNRVSAFGRYERAEKDELFATGEHAHDPLVFTIHRYTFGGVYNLPVPGLFDWGIGSSVSAHQKPEILDLFYGSKPRSVTFFLRFRVKPMSSVPEKN
jgi:hypothetical protein